MTRRKGWRKQPRTEGRMRLAESYATEDGLKVTKDERSGLWYYYGPRIGNSLWLTPPKSFAMAIEAMLAAEAAMEAMP